MLVDNQSYFEAVAAAIRSARHSIWLLGWEFDPRTALKPASPVGEQDEIGELLKQAANDRPELRIRVLIWDASLAVAAGVRLMPQRARHWFDGSRVEFKLDSTVPQGASHHQKLLVVDDLLAFCSSADFLPNRWDRCEHADHDPDRVTLSAKEHPPRHATTMLVSGEAARPMGELARERWKRCTGEAIPPTTCSADEAIWPAGVDADFQDVPIGLSRTFPQQEHSAELRENEELYLAGIRAARKLLYFENQYFTSPVIGEAIAARLQEPGGPEVIVINGEHAPSTFDRVTMDPARDELVARLREADRFGKFSVYTPETAGGAAILVHSKLMIVDDRFIRIGSSNLANRSLGFDTECDLSVEVDGNNQDRRAITGVLVRLIAHLTGCPSEEVEKAISSTGGLARAIDILNSSERRRLRPLSPDRPGFPASIVSDNHLGDPLSASQAWRPWRGGRG